MRLSESLVAGIAGLTMTLAAGTAMAADSALPGVIETQHDQGTAGAAPAPGSAMQELIETLHDNGTIDDAAYTRLKAAAAAGKRQQAAPVATI